MRLIDADVLLDSIFKSCNTTEATINNAPTIDAAPVVRGKWKQGKEFSAYPRVPFTSAAYYCSNCEEEAYWDTDYGQQLFDFCPNCGCQMEV